MTPRNDPGEDWSSLFNGGTSYGRSLSARPAAPMPLARNGLQIYEFVWR
jgi:hypothetical protein